MMMVSRFLRQSSCFLPKWIEKRLFWSLMSAVSDPLALHFGDFTRVKWSHADMLLVCMSIFSLALGLIIGLEDWGSFSSSYRWLDALMMACWKAGMLKRSSKSHSDCHRNMSPGGKTKHDVTRERSKYESLIYLFTMGEMCVCVRVLPVCVCVELQEKWRHVVSLQLSRWLVVIQHRFAPTHFKAARGSKLYYCKLHHTVKCSSSLSRAS